jgi:hypothetical protein
MSEILQAEIVAYSSPKEIFVNGSSCAQSRISRAAQCNLIDMTGTRPDRLPVKAFGCSGLWKN